VFVGRAIGDPIAALVFPAVWWVAGRPRGWRAYTDTLGDLTLALTGSIVAALLTVTVLWPRRAPA
jgi:hypothetical protein